MEQKVQANVEEVKTESTENVEVQTTEKVEQKTFTQNEVNNIVKDRVAKVEKKYANIDINKYNEYIESQKTEAEKQEELKRENTELKNKITELENANVVANANVDPKFQKFVINEVTQLGGDFKEQLDTYLKDNEQYLIKKETPKVTTGVPLNGENVVDENKAYLDKKYANNPYYKK